MLYPLIGLLLGLLLGVVLPFEIPIAYSSYLSIAILAALNSVFGGIQADLEGKFDQKLFVTGFFGNTILAALLTYIGDRVGIPIYYAAIFYFGTSLFSNFAKIRRYYFKTEKRDADTIVISEASVSGREGRTRTPEEIDLSSAEAGEADDLGDEENFDTEETAAVEKLSETLDDDEVFEDDEALDEVIK